MKNLYCVLVASFIFMGCNDASRKETAALTTAESIHLPKKDTSEAASSDTLQANSDYQTMFIIVADTSTSYNQLHQKMFRLHNMQAFEIDTMGRYFNKAKDMIVLPEDDEDDIYAGDYFPRRFPSRTVSLEYLNMYQPKAKEKTIALVAGIYESEKSADSALSALKAGEQKAFKVKSSVYVGCMH